MSEIPADIMSAAISVADKVSFGGYEQNALAIARAILAERQKHSDLVEAMEGCIHFQDALAFRTDHLSKALNSWINGGREAVKKLGSIGPSPTQSNTGDAA